MKPQKHNNEKFFGYVSIYNKTNPELFAEITKSLEQLKNNDRIKNLLNTANKLHKRDISK